MSFFNSSLFNNFSRFDVESSKWIQLANMKEGVSGATVCNFDDKFIYRFGGKTILN